MGYNLRIGEATIYNEDGCININCPVISLPDAPTFGGGDSDRQNQRLPSYTVWHECMRTLDLLDVMFDSRNGGNDCGFSRNGMDYRPLISEHPGVVPILRGHVEEVEERLARYKAEHPTHKAAYPPPKKGAVPLFGDVYRDKDYETDPTYDWALVRGEWLAWWLRWAYENCSNPVFVNS